MHLCFQCLKPVTLHDKVGQYRCPRCAIFIEEHQVIDEEKHQNFERVQYPRIPKIAKQLQLLENGARGATYQYGTQEIQDLFRQLDEAVASAKRAYIADLRKNRHDTRL